MAGPTTLGCQAEKGSYPPESAPRLYLLGRAGREDRAAWPTRRSGTRAGAVAFPPRR
jgi:hypothetical protein